MLRPPYTPVFDGDYYGKVNNRAPKEDDQHRLVMHLREALSGGRRYCYET